MCRDQIMKVARLERAAADRDQQIANLQAKLAEKAAQTQPGYQLVLETLKTLLARDSA